MDKLVEKNGIESFAFSVSGDTHLKSLEKINYLKINEYLLKALFRVDILKASRSNFLNKKMSHWFLLLRIK